MHRLASRREFITVWRIKDGRFRRRPLEEATLAATEPTKAPRSQEMRRTWMSVGKLHTKMGMRICDKARSQAAKQTNGVPHPVQICSKPNKKSDNFNELFTKFEKILVIDKELT